MNMPQDAGAAPAAPESQSVSGLARQHFDTVGPDGRQRGDAQPAQVAFIIKSIRIAEVAGHPQFGRKADAVAINKLRKTTVLQIALRFPLLREISLRSGNRSAICRTVVFRSLFMATASAFRPNCGCPATSAIRMLLIMKATCAG